MSITQEIEGNATFLMLREEAAADVQCCVRQVPAMAPEVLASWYGAGAPSAGGPAAEAPGGAAMPVEAWMGLTAGIHRAVPGVAGNPLDLQQPVPVQDAVLAGANEAFDKLHGGGQQMEQVGALPLQHRQLPLLCTSSSSLEAFPFYICVHIVGSPQVTCSLDLRNSFCQLTNDMIFMATHIACQQLVREGESYVYAAARGC